MFEVVRVIVGIRMILAVTHWRQEGDDDDGGMVVGGGMTVEVVIAACVKMVAGWDDGEGCGNRRC